MANYFERAKFFRTKKRLGQNFLVDGEVIQDIIEFANISPEDTIVEIGPGVGFVTEQLVKYAKKVIAIELDEEAIRELKKLDAPNLEIIHNDVLKTDLSALTDGEFKVVANIPYYITSPIIAHLLGEIDDLNNKIIYVETSRGCPFKCGYCMASLDNKLRYFDIEKIKDELLILINNGGKVFKFLDRTFNANKNNFISLIDFIIKNHKQNNSFQFEITGDLLEKDVIEYINKNAPKNLFRFEIGIQSTNIKANKAVYRIQNNEKLFEASFEALAKVTPSVWTYFPFLPSTIAYKK